MYTRGGAAYGTLLNLVKGSNLPVSKVRDFLHSKPLYTEFTLATRKLKRMKAFARFEIEIWCMDLAYVDKLSKDNNGVKYLLARQDLLVKIVDAKRVKTKISKEMVPPLLTMITKKNRPTQFWVDKGTEFAGGFGEVCKVEGIHIYSTMSETKAALAERIIRSLKKILYMEDYRYKYIHKMSQFVTTLNSRKKIVRLN